MNSINNNLSVKFDNTCDYIPFVSTLSNLTDLFMKSIYLKVVGDSSVTQGHYFTHIKQKSFTRMAILLIPIFGNLCVAIHDFVNRERHKTLDAVRRNGLNLEFAKPEFQDDEEIVWEALRWQAAGEALKFASPRLQNDEKIVHRAVKHIGVALQYASERLKDDYHTVLYAVAHNDLALRFASKRLQDDELIVTRAVSYFGGALEFANERFKDKEELVVKAMTSYALAINFASPRVRDLIAKYKK